MKQISVFAKILFLIAFLTALAGSSLAQSQPPLYVAESDGSPGGYVTRLIVSNGTLTISGRTATLTISGGGGGVTTTGSPVSGQFALMSGANSITGSNSFTYIDGGSGGRFNLDNALRLLIHGGDANNDYAQLSVNGSGQTTLSETISGTSKNFYVGKIRTTGNPSTAGGNLAFFSTAGGTAIGEISQSNAITLANSSPQFIINPSGSSTNTSLWLQSYGSPAYNYLWRANGSSSSPTAILSGDTIGGFQWDGRRTDLSVSNNYPARLYAVAKENWTGTDHQAAAIRLANSLAGVGSFPEKDSFEFYRSSTTLTTMTLFGNAQNAGIRFNGAQLEWSNDSSSWTPFGSGGTPGGSTKQIQFNNSGAFGGAAGFEYQSGASPNVTITGQNATHIPLTVIGAASNSAAVLVSKSGSSGTGDLWQGQNSSGTPLIKIRQGDANVTNLPNIEGNFSNLAVGSPGAFFLYAGTQIAFRKYGGGIPEVNVDNVYFTTGSIGTQYRTNETAYLWMNSNGSAQAGSFRYGAAGDINQSAWSMGTLSAYTAENQDIFRVFNGTLVTGINAGLFAVDKDGARVTTIHGPNAQSGQLNNAGTALQLAGGKGTGNAAGGVINLQTSDAGSSGTTLQALTTKLSLNSSNLILTSAGQYQFGSSGITSPDAGLARNRAGWISLTNGSTGAGSLTVPDVSGTDQAGLALTFGGGRGTGTGAGGAINFQVAPAGSTGSSANSLVTAASVTTRKTINVVATATPTLTDGDFYNDSSIKSYTAVAGGLRGALTSTFAVNNGATTVTATSDTTLVGLTSWSTAILPANYLTVGRQIVIEGGGYYSSSAGGPTITMKLKLTSGGPVTLVSSGAVTLAASMSNQPWRVRAVVSVVSIGTSATAHVQGVAEFYDSFNGIWTIVPLNTATAAGFDSTVAETIDLTAAFGAAGSSVTATRLTFSN